MNVKIFLFAHLKEMFGSNSIDLELQSDLSVQELVQAITQQFPQLAPDKVRYKVASDGEILSDGDKITLDQEIALLPPVSGG